MGRAPCCDKNGLKKGPWTPEEDLKLVNYIQTHGPGNWRTLPKNAGLQRCGKSCRLRWTNYLRPDIKRGRFSFEEEETIIQLHSVLGNKWSAIAARLPGRTDNEIKNYWNTHIRKRLLRSGIDPVTHAPRLDLLDLSSILSSSLSCTNLLNLSNLLSTQALLNPDMLRLASTILSLRNENPDLLQQNFQENNLCNSSQPQQNHFETPVPPCTTTSNAPCPPLLNQTQPMQSDIEDFLSNFVNPQRNDFTTPMLSENFVSQPSYNPAATAPLENMNFQLNNGDQNLRVDSIISTPLSSSTPLNSSSAFVNSSPEDEKESYCSSYFKFDIPDSLDISDFI
ncbi:transcription factor MYB41 [Punica granatum]|uniref:Transcription factor MYB41 n=1 Tax=Punica granatum TaxID=22663 RepID=A0A218Y2C5_PUNGR|nr:transcription factor MYB41 [Punica granatum]OWM90989.1 hypothetical protein CDL15_Pgr023322 [Punica granatum]